MVLSVSSNSRLFALKCPCTDPFKTAPLTLSKLSLRIISNSNSSRSENADWSLCEQQPMIPSKCLLISSQTASSKALKNPSSDHFKQQPLMLQNAGWSSPNSSLSRSKTQADPFQTVASLKSPFSVWISLLPENNILSPCPPQYYPQIIYVHVLLDIMFDRHQKLKTIAISFLSTWWNRLSRMNSASSAWRMAFRECFVECSALGWIEKSGFL